MFEIFPLFLKCPGCGEPPSVDTIPLCTVCAAALVDCPPLCPRCANPACGGGVAPCTGPHGAVIKSYSARYLLAGTGFTVLKRWKTSHGPLFDRLVLKANTSFLNALGASGCGMAGSDAARASAVVPVPQQARRAMMLGGSPAQKFAAWLARLCDTPVLDALRMRSLPHWSALGNAFGNTFTGTNTRQAELNRAGRLEKNAGFVCDCTHTLQGRSVILADDFMTTGRTVRLAAEELARAGASEVHVVCLGLRPRKILGSSI